MPGPVHIGKDKCNSGCWCVHGTDQKWIIAREVNELLFRDWLWSVAWRLARRSPATLRCLLGTKGRVRKRSRFRRDARATKKYVSAGSPSFDNDGTLSSSRLFPDPVRVDRVKALDKHPNGKQAEPFKSVLADDLRSAQTGELACYIVAATHTNMTVDEFHETVKTACTKH